MEYVKIKKVDSEEFATIRINDEDLQNYLDQGYEESTYQEWYDGCSDDVKEKLDKGEGFE